MGTTLSDDFIIGFGCCSCDFVTNRKSQIRIHFDSKHKTELTDDSTVNVDQIKDKINDALSNQISEQGSSHSHSQPNGNDILNPTSDVNQTGTKTTDKVIIINAAKSSTKYSTYDIRKYVESHPSITLADDDKKIQSKTIFVNFSLLKL